MKDVYFYIEFEITNTDRFIRLQKFFNKLKEVKDGWTQDTYLEEKNDRNYYDPVDSFPWQDYLDDEANRWFANSFDYDSEEGIIYWKLWELTAPEIRLQHPFFKTPGNWHFESMLDAIFNGDYSLVDLVKEKEHQGCLYYSPRAYPFGGSDSLIELIRSFGNQIIYDSWYKNSHPKRETEWNYTLAKKLVRLGIGFTPELLLN